MKYNTGDKVIPIAKSYFWDSTFCTAVENLSNSNIWKRSKEFGYMVVLYYNSKVGYYSCGVPNSSNGLGGDFFIETDLVPYQSGLFNKSNLINSMKIMPRCDWLKHRAKDLETAIAKFKLVGELPPKDYIIELKTINTELRLQDKKYSIAFMVKE